MAMDTTQAQQFIETLERDPNFQTQFAVASPNSLDGVIDFTSAKGYVFTKTELEAVLKHFPDSSIYRQLRQYVR